MKKTQFIDAIKNIKNRLPSFLSVILVVAIGTGGFFTTQNIYRTLDGAFEGFYEQQNFKDLDLVSAGGIVESDVEAVSKVQGVDAVEAVIHISGELTDKENKYNVQIVSLTEKVSVPALLEGKLPAKANEVAINEDLAEESGLKPGDKVTIKNTSDLSSDPLKEEEFTVTAIIRHPEYLRNAQTWAIVLPLSAFDFEATNNSYTNLYVTGDDKIEEELWKLLPVLKSQTTLRVQDQADELIGKATDEVNEQLQEAEEKIKEEEDSAMAQLDEAEQQISSFESLFVNGKKQIEEGKKKLAEAYEQLTAAEAQIASGQSQLNRAKDAYNQIEEKLRPIKEKIGQDVSGEELLELLETLNMLIEGFKDALESDNQDQIIWALDALLSALDDETISKLLDGLEVADDIIDTDALFDMIDEKKEILYDIVNERTEMAIEFLGYFTENGLKNYLSKLDQYLADLAAAIEDGSDDDIEKAKAAIEDFFSEEGSVIINRFLDRYTGYSLEDLFDKIQNVETENTLKKVKDNLNTIIIALNAVDSLPVPYQKILINTAIDYIGGLATDYAQGIAEGDQDMIDMANTAIDRCLADEKVQATIAVIEQMTGQDIEAFIADVRSGNLVVDQIEAFVSGLKEAVNNADPPEGFVPGYVVPILEQAWDIVDSAILLPENYSKQKYEDLMEALDKLEKTDFVYVVIEAIDEIYGFNFWDIVQPIYDLDTYIEMIQASAHQMIEYLIYETDFLEEYSADYIKETINGYLQALETLEESMRNQDLDYHQIITNIKTIIEIMSDDSFKFIKELVLEYFNENIDIDLSRIVPVDKIEALQEKLDELDEPIRLYAQLEKQIKDGERKLNAARSEVEAGWKEYYAGLEELRNKEKLLNGSGPEIAEARAQLEQKKQEATLALQEAKDKLAQARKEAEETIANKKEEILNRNYNWVIQNRNTNQSYADTRGPINGAKGSSTAFGALFFIVIALVCFSTIAIIVEEEKKSVGTTKAFGFYNREILGKHLIFGLSAAVIGSILGCIIGFVVCRLVLNYFEGSNVYLVGKYKVITSPLVMVIASLGVAALCAIATYVACSDLLKSPAALLMKGETIATRNRKNKKKELRTNKPKQSLYSRLILRNIINEKERVMITVFIVAISCFCTGIGITLRDGFVGMLEKQKTDVYLYDFRVNYTGDITSEELKHVETILSQNDADYLVANYSVHLFEKDQKINALYVVTADKDRLNSFIAVKDPKTRQSLTLPEEGVLVQLRLDESYGISPGTYLTLYDDQLETYQARVAGRFQNYQGRLVLASKEAYSQIFNEEVTDNCYFVRLNRNNYDTVSRQLSDIKHISIEKADSYKQAMENAIGLFNIIIILMTLMSVLMSFMILTNLANIYITRKKKELIVMRINGFSIKETIRYLAKETVLTTVLGAVLALIMGYFLGIVPIHVLEQPDAQFIRSFNVKAWIIAIVVESVFSMIINSMVFRKVKDLNFREVL